MYRNELNAYLILLKKIVSQLPARQPSSEKKLSPFFKNVGQLYWTMYKKLEREPKEPFWYADAWHERKLQLDILQQGLILTEKSNATNDHRLFLICYFLVKHSSTPIFCPYNFFIEELQDVLEMADIQQQIQEDETILTNQLTLMREALDQQTIREAKTTLLNKLFIDHALVELDSVLKSIGGDKLVANYVATVNQIFVDRLSRKQSIWEAKLVELEERGREMEQIISLLTKEYALAIEVVEKFKQKSPKLYEEVVAEVTEQLHINKPNMTHKEIAAILPKFSLLKDNQQANTIEEGDGFFVQLNLST